MHSNFINDALDFVCYNFPQSIIYRLCIHNHQTHNTCAAKSSKQKKKSATGFINYFPVRLNVGAKLYIWLIKHLLLPHKPLKVRTWSVLAVAHLQAETAKEKLSAAANLRTPELSSTIFRVSCQVRFHGEDPSDFTACKQSDDIQPQEAFEELPGERDKVYEQGGPLRHTETMWVLCSQGLALIQGSWERLFERSSDGWQRKRATYSRCFASRWQKVSLHAGDWQKVLCALLRSEAFFWGALSLLPCREKNKTPFTSPMQSHQEVCGVSIRPFSVH